MAPPRLAAAPIASFQHASDSPCFRSAPEQNIYRRPIYLADFRRGKEASLRGRPYKASHLPITSHAGASVFSSVQYCAVSTFNASTICIISTRKSRESLPLTQAPLCVRTWLVG